MNATSFILSNGWLPVWECAARDGFAGYDIPVTIYLHTLLRRFQPSCFIGHASPLSCKYESPVVGT